MKNKKYQSGFTITELSIAMTMLSVLLVVILLSILNITEIYNKGLTLKRVNQSGSAIARNLQTSLRKSSPGNVLSTSRPLTATETVNTRLCTGIYSFVWSVLGNGANAIESFSSGEEISLIRVKDSSAKLCKPDPPDIDKNDPSVTVLLGDALVIRQPTGVTISDDLSLVTMQFTISTLADSSDIIYDTSGRAACSGDSNDDFCALNTFVVTSYAKGI